MQRTLRNILVTGGAGFIGANFIHFLFSDESGFHGTVVNVDRLTYAGNLESVADISRQYKGTRYFFEKADICDRVHMERIFSQYDIDTVVHFAAESHVDRSIATPETFMKTNTLGTCTLLDVARAAWQKADGSIRSDVLFHHVSTDEVYGSLGATGRFTENTPYAPRSPYSASKAASDHVALAYFHTYGMPLTISNCSNNYGPYQFPEKLLPLMIIHIRDGKELPVYGTGKNIRDWIYVADHNRAVWCILNNGRAGEKYNIGGENEWQNITLLHKVIELTAEALGIDAAAVQKTIIFVKDRPGHDRRYAIDCTKIKTELGWHRTMPFESGLRETIHWYLTHREWVQHILSGEYINWIEKNYSNR
ncbi:MAG: dTDP-glucose 4,6-dehydratase [Treponema sp.]|nr:dTDP-glucose 4,6-dehydratase [Treponema sp.]